MKRILDEFENIIDYDNLFISEVINSIINSRIKIPTIIDFKSFVDQSITINSTIYNLTSIVDTNSTT